MKYKDIKDFYQRCEAHQDHQTGMISAGMLSCRMQEEIDELREYIEQRTWVGLTNDEVNNVAAGCHLGNSVQDAIYKAEAKLKERNT